MQYMVRKVIPVEQGLRRFHRIYVVTQCYVRKVIPVEQGLRLQPVNVFFRNHVNS